MDRRTNWLNLLKPPSIKRRLKDMQHRVLHSQGPTTGARLHRHVALVHSPVDQDLREHLGHEPKLAGA